MHRCPETMVNKNMKIYTIGAESFSCLPDVWCSINDDDILNGGDNT